VRAGIYTDDQEEKIFIRREARAWARSGMITEAQLGIVHERTDPGLSQTNVFFRILFFVFTYICVQTVIGLYLWLSGFKSNAAFAWTSLLFGAASYGLAEYLVRRRSFYRYGIEEALALGSITLICWGLGTFIYLSGAKSQLLITAGALLASSTAFWLYLRFGFLYAAVLSIAAACVVPFQLSLPSTSERMLLVAVLALILLVSIRAESFETRDFARDKNTSIQAFLLAGIYFTLNMRLHLLGRMWFDPDPYDPYAGVPPLFYWATYGLTFLVPVLGLYHGLHKRKRIIINVSLIASLLTLATNKDYLGLKHYSWDPVILGVTMVVGAIIITRWLDNGDKEMRNGFTAQSLLKPEDYGINLADIGAAALPGALGAPPQEPQADRPFEGGQSGGGGASSNY
jgi:hypothetical protein